MSTDSRFAVEPRTRPLWRRVLLGLLAILIIAVLAVSISSLSGRNNVEPMHPDSVSADGAGALAAIMSDRGMTITVVHTADEALNSGGTILVWDPERILSPADRARLLSHDRLVVVSDSGRDTYQWFGSTLGVTTGPENEMISPSCTVDWLAGIEVTGVTVGVNRAGCFPVGSGSHVVVRGGLVYFASPELFINENLASADNAAVAIRALAETDTVTWLMPVRETIDEPALSVVPPALTGALIGFVLLALWWGLLVRRPFGPLIPEQLPVIVPSAESARGRARLYERGRNAGHAGAALRAGLISTHAGRLGLATDASAETVVAKIAGSSGWPAEQVHDLLYGPPPRTDSELTELAHRLDTLSKELHHD